FHSHRSIVQLGKQFHHGQSESCSFKSPCQTTINLTERLKEPLHPVDRNTNAIVNDTDFEKLFEWTMAQREAPSHPGSRQLSNFASGNADCTKSHNSAVGSKLHCVGEKVIHNLIDLARIRLD